MDPIQESGSAKRIALGNDAVDHPCVVKTDSVTAEFHDVHLFAI
ncbi:MAG: hypothetical protein ACRD4E_07780 [Bryobacteraceae bacterium]